MKIITSLHSLLEELDSSTKEEFASIGARLEIPLSDLKDFMHWSPKHYTRNCIKRTEHYELILLCWEEGQETPVHCHGGEECWVYLVEGKLREKHYQLIDNNLIEESTETMITGQKSFMCDELGYHSLENIDTKRSMSLHLYMDPIDNCTAYSTSKKEFTSVNLSYFSYEGSLVDTMV